MTALARLQKVVMIATGTVLKILTVMEYAMNSKSRVARMWMHAITVWKPRMTMAPASLLMPVMTVMAFVFRTQMGTVCVMNLKFRIAQT